MGITANHILIRNIGNIKMDATKEAVQNPILEVAKAIVSNFLL